MYSTGQVDFRRCSSCDAAFRDPMPSHDELDRIYALHYASENIAANRTNQESGTYALRQYAQFVQANAGAARVLDYGAGSGEFVELLMAAGLVVTGVEFSASAREFCERNRGFRLLPSIEEVAPATIDAITMIEVVEHLTAPRDTLRELFAALRPGGKIVITTPNRNGLRALIEKGFWREAKKKFHLVLFTPGALKTALKCAGFVNCEVVRFYPPQKPGLLSALYTRATQAIGAPGTVFLTAERPV